MARKPGIPRKHFHRASGQWRLRLGGHDHYLGADREAADAKEARLVRDWLAGGGAARPKRVNSPMVSDLCAAYLAERERLWAARVQRTAADMLPTSSAVGHVRMAVKRLMAHGETPADEFGPRQLRALLVDCAAEGLARETIGRLLNVVRRLWEWAEREGMVPEGHASRLLAVRQPLSGDEAGYVPAPIRPVPWDHVERVLAAAPADLAAAVRLQHLTGMRPGELSLLRGDSITREEADLWVFEPYRHKTMHHGRARRIWLGPQAVEVLAPLLPSDPAAPVFAWTEKAYRKRLYALQDRLGVPRWGPNRLRHSRATEVRKRYHLEGAAAVLGDTVDVAAVYAERDEGLARRIAREMG